MEDTPPAGAPAAPYRANRRERWKADGPDGLWLYCNDGGHWLPVSRFRLIGSKRQRYNSLCRSCENERSVAWQRRNPERARAFARRHEAKVTPKMLARADRQYMAWLEGKKHTDVPIDQSGPLADLMIETGRRQHDDYTGLAAVSGVTTRTLQRIRYRQGRNGPLSSISLDTLERLAAAVGLEDRLRLDLPGDADLGRDGWAATGERYCRSCGSWWHPHKAQALCHRCYGSWLRNGFEDPGYLWYERERFWSFIHRLHACLACGRSDRKHSGRGLCTSCRTREDRRHNKAGQLREGDHRVLAGLS